MEIKIIYLPICSEFFDAHKDASEIWLRREWYKHRFTRTQEDAGMNKRIEAWYNLIVLTEILKVRGIWDSTKKEPYKYYFGV